MFAILTLIAFLIAPGPSSANGVTVVEYYTAHGDAAIWQAVLAGFGIVCFLWFAGTFAATLPSANAVLVSAGAMAAIYLVTLGAWEALAETYKDVDIVDVPSEGYGDAHVLYDVGVGAAHLASFADAAFVGATAVALLSGAVVRWRRLGWVGVGLTVVWLINAPLQIFGTSDWSDAVGAVIFVSLLGSAVNILSQLQIAFRRQRRKEIETLENKTDLAPPQIGARRVAHRGQIFAIHYDLA